MKWETVKLGDICRLVTSGGTPLTSVPSYYEPKEIPWLKTGEVNYCRIYEAENYISKEGLEHSSAKLIPENSVIIAMYGQGDTAGRVAIKKIPLPTNQACCNLIIDPKVAHYEYVYYALCTLYEYLVAQKSGGAQPNLNAKKIKDIKIPLPPLESQLSIAASLSAYDDLIENNQKQIKLLEEAAQRLYKEWFVDLRFPGYETTPVHDGVPEGWAKTTVEKAAAILRRGISPSYDENGDSTVINQKCIRQTIVDLDEARKQTKKYPDDLNLQDGDTVICSTGDGTLGRVGQIFGKLENTTLDSHVTLVRATSEIGAQLLFWTVKSQQAFLQGMGKGSTNQLELSRSVIQELPFTLPNPKTRMAFEVLAQAIHDKITAQNKQIIVLQTARDRLLPKIMSGEIEV